MLDSTFGQVAVVLGVAAVVGGLTVALKQPLIVGFIGVGILVGPAGFGWVTADEPFGVFAELGISVLLFLVGLKLDPQLVRTTGPVALATGLGQVRSTSIVGYGIALALGLEPLQALYVAVALTFSSTIIIIKLLSDKRELDRLHGRIAVGLLIFQDRRRDRPDRDHRPGRRGGRRGGGRAAARNQELLVLFAVAWAVAVAAVGDNLELSAEVNES